MSSVLVTGANGFVGAHLCRTLVQRGWRVLGGHRAEAPAAAIEGVAAVRLPLGTEPARWLEALASIDCVVHLAAHVHQMARGRGESDAQYEEINVGGSRFVAELAARAGVKRFVFLSSAKVNGEGGSSRPYRAEDPPAPQDAYGRSKAAAENAIREVCRGSGMEFVAVRPPLVYGPGVRANFRRLLGLARLGAPLPFASIGNRRSLVGVENLVDFIVTAMTHAKAAGNVWLVTDGEDISTRDLIERLARLMNRSARFFPCPPSLLKFMAGLAGRGAEAARLCESFLLDASPARLVLDWSPPQTLQEELQRTVADYLKRGQA